MNEVELYDGSDHIQDLMDKVATRILQGKSELAIARDLGIKRTEVINYRDMWKNRMANDMSARDSARDHLNQMVEHYSRLIDKSYKVLDDLDNMSFDEKVAAQKNTTLKNISEYEAKRVDALQKAGLLDASDLGDEMAEMEEKQQILIDILRNDLCPTCRPNVMHKLKRVTGQVEEIRVEQVIDAEIVEDEPNE